MERTRDSFCGNEFSSTEFLLIKGFSLYDHLKSIKLKAENPGEARDELWVQSRMRQEEE